MMIVYVGMAMVALSGGVVYYYNTTQATIMQLTENNAQLEANIATVRESNEKNIATIRNLEASYKRVQEDYQELQGQFQEIRNQNSQLKDRLGKHEIDVLAAEKPALVERVIDRASEKAGRCFELITGAPLTEDEQNADTPQKFNSECPWLYDTIGSGKLLKDAADSGSPAN